MTSTIEHFALLGLFLLLFVLLSFVALLLHKTRQIHLATYKILDDTTFTRQEASVLFAQIQALFALERKLGMSEALPPMRGWAASPDFLMVVADEILTRKPQTVMECSSGVSTLVAARCLQLNGSGHVYSLEHEIHYANKTRDLLNKYGLTEWASVLDAPLQTKHTETPWYSEEAIPENLAPIDLLVVDGPPASTAPLARFPALPRLLPRMAKDALVILDDADRDDEQEMIRQWILRTPELRQTNRFCEKGCVVIQLKNNYSL